jgi:hypothetical protein
VRAHTEHRENFTEVAEAMEPSEKSTFTTMAPPKQAEASQSARQPRVRTRSQVQLEEGEQQPSEIVNVDEIPSPDTTPVNPTPVVEETQQPTPEGTNVDMHDRGTGAAEPGCRNPEGGATREH